MKVSHSRAPCYGVSKWRLLICQSICGLCKTNQDNPMMIGFLGDEMTLKTTLLVWELVVTFNGLISCLTNPDERFQPSMTSTNIGVLFSTRANLYCRISFLSIKHVNALESRNAWASIITSLLHLIMIGTKKHGVGFEDRLGPFSLHDASRSSLMIPIETGHAYFPTPLVVD